MKLWLLIRARSRLWLLGALIVVLGCSGLEGGDSGAEGLASDSSTLPVLGDARAGSEDSVEAVLPGQREEEAGQDQVPVQEDADAAPSDAERLDRLLAQQEELAGRLDSLLALRATKDSLPGAASSEAVIGQASQ